MPTPGLPQPVLRPAAPLPSAPELGAADPSWDRGCTSSYLVVGRRGRFSASAQPNPQPGTRARPPLRGAGPVSGGRALVDGGANRGPRQPEPGPRAGRRAGSGVGCAQKRGCGSRRGRGLKAER